ncbi:MAG: peptidoglycan DD-metalloendopeptidase family protein [Spirochaetales bacterium]
MRGIIETQRIDRRPRGRTESRATGRPGRPGVGHDFALGGADPSGVRPPDRRRAEPANLRSVAMRDPRRRLGRARAALPGRPRSRRSRVRNTIHRAVSRIPGAALATAVAVPVAIVASALLMPILGAFDFYAQRVGLRIPRTPSETLLATVDTMTGQGGGETLAIDATNFERIRRVEYEVEPGDTISEIAYEFGIEPGTILSMNPIDDVRRLLPGTTLSIPDRDGLFHAVQPSESLSSIAGQYGVPVAPILDANDLETSVLQVGETLFVPGAEMDENEYLLAIGELFQWPVRNFRFTSGYGMRSDPFTGQWRMHTGIDLANAVGTPVLAARPGRVVHLEPNTGTLGNMIILDHGDGFRSLYGHLDSFNVTNGQRVSAGQMIGRIGNTGRSTGPHLHFSVIRQGRWEDPLKHMP